MDAMHVMCASTHVPFLSLLITHRLDKEIRTQLEQKIDAIEARLFQVDKERVDALSLAERLRNRNRELLALADADSEAHARDEGDMHKQIAALKEELRAEIKGREKAERSWKEAMAAYEASHEEAKDLDMICSEQRALLAESKSSKAVLQSTLVKQLSSAREQLEARDGEVEQLRSALREQSLRGRLHAAEFLAQQ